MHLRVDWYGSVSGRVGDCGHDDADEGSDAGGDDCQVDEGHWVRIVVVFFVLPTPGSDATHPVGFVAR